MIDPITARAAQTVSMGAGSGGADASADQKATDERLMGVAKDLEASFLAEMLKSAGLGKTSESFGGGIGEDQFSSFLVQEQAEAMVEAGGIGLAQSIFEALKEQGDGPV